MPAMDEKMSPVVAVEPACHLTSVAERPSIGPARRS